MALINEKNPAPQDNIIDITIDGIQKQKFRINGDSSKILELNISDMNIISRLSETYKKLDKLAQQAGEFDEKELEDNTPEALDKLTAKLQDIDDKMRELVDYLFDSNVSEVCAGNGSMYDPMGGQYRYEHIISSLAPLYKNNFSKEFSLMKQNIRKRTAKYTKK